VSAPPASAIPVTVTLDVVATPDQGIFAGLILPVRLEIESTSPDVFDVVPAYDVFFDAGTASAPSLGVTGTIEWIEARTVPSTNPEEWRLFIAITPEPSLGLLGGSVEIWLSGDGHRFDQPLPYFERIGTRNTYVSVRTGTPEAPVSINLFGLAQNVVIVPEPDSGILGAAGLLLLGAARWRKRPVSGGSSVDAL
jgi:hypothetical protein